MYYTYIVFSEKLDKFYVGATEDLHRRMEEHNTGRSPYTKTGSPWQLVWSREFKIRSEALAEERRIKGKKSRKYIEWLIDSAGKAI
ncbi:GIY-YIG nuclease superfamily protein [Cesiribacter andamanensis AMV16]|uniref:GIY-YIG nuclease superfamily protein n=2 Tax=Cesiribacter TaxID=1133570 RepID=M7NA76_9BACT|nr:GIY-YIG nuclease superfamily protein [Cesiribacter andamanensis AMV16]